MTRFRNLFSETVDPYCIVSVVTRFGKDTASKFYAPTEKNRISEVFEVGKSRSLPRVFEGKSKAAQSIQHHESFGTLPNGRTKKVSFSQLEVRRTVSLAQTMDPVWSEQFEM